MILKLINNENTYEFNVTDLNEGVKLYYHFEIPTADIPDGKYNMQLLDGETVIYEDIVCIGDFKGATIQYKRGENIYINAPLVGKFEDVTVEITATQTTVYPNDGFDAMTSVVIDATPVYENGYNSGNADGYRKGYDNGNIIGYNSGYTDGETVGYNNGYLSGYTDGVEIGGIETLENLPILNITENGEYNTPSKGVNVNVITKIVIGDSGFKFGEMMTTLPDWFDFSKTFDMSYMFRGCSNLSIISDLNAVAAKKIEYMCYECRNLLSIGNIGSDEITSMQYAFAYCKVLESLPAINASNFNQYSLIGVFRNGGTTLTNFGGLQNLKANWNDEYGLALCPNLSYQSCINVLNGLYDFTGNGETPTSLQGQLKVHPNFLTTVGDEISIGTSKSWTITA